MTSANRTIKTQAGVSILTIDNSRIVKYTGDAVHMVDTSKFHSTRLPWVCNIVNSVEADIPFRLVVDSSWNTICSQCKQWNRHVIEFKNGFPLSRTTSFNPQLYPCDPKATFGWLIVKGVNLSSTHVEELLQHPFVEFEHMSVSFGTVEGFCMPLPLLPKSMLPKMDAAVSNSSTPVDDVVNSSTTAD